MNFINAGVIGLGFIGPQHIDAICRAPDARLTATRTRTRPMPPQSAIMWKKYIPTGGK